MNYKKNIIFSLVSVGIIPILSFFVSEYPINIGLCRYVYNSTGELQGRNCIIDLGFLQPLFFLSLVTFIFLPPSTFSKKPFISHGENSRFGISPSLPSLYFQRAVEVTALIPVTVWIPNPSPFSFPVCSPSSPSFSSATNP